MGGVSIRRENKSDSSSVPVGGQDTFQFQRLSKILRGTLNEERMGGGWKEEDEWTEAAGQGVK